MALHEEIIIDVTDNGLDQATKKVNALGVATSKTSKETEELSNSMKSSSNAVLDNGGAVGLLNEVTGGFASTVKDAVEASVLFTKSQKIASATQSFYSTVVGTSTGAMKLFRIALVSTGIGAIVVGIGLLIANFDKVKKVVLNLVPGLAIIGDLFSGLVQAVTDFIGVTSDASRELDKMVAKSEESLKRSEHFLEANGDKYDAYTQRKIKANIDFNKKVLELSADEELTEQEKLKRIEDFRLKQNREIVKADADREAELSKNRKAIQDKIDEENKKIAEKRKADADARIKAEQDRLKIVADYEKKLLEENQNINDKSEQEKLDRQKERAIAEINLLKTTAEEKLNLMRLNDEKFFELQKELDEKNSKVIEDINKARIEAERNLILDQKQWEIDNEKNPITKLEKQRELITMQGELDLQKLESDIANAQLSATERAKAENDYKLKKQDIDQSILDNEKSLAEQRKILNQAVEDAKIAVSMRTLDLVAEIAGQGSKVGKGIAVAQATISGIEGVQNAFTTASKSPVTTVFPAYPFIQAGLAGSFSALQIKKILSTDPSGKSTPSVGSSSGGATPPSAPSFNLVQGTGANQIAESIGGQNKPLQAFVVSSNVSTAQAMDRNIVENSTF